MDTMKRKRQFIFNIYSISSSLYLFIFFEKKKILFYQILDNLKIPIPGFSTEFVNTHTELSFSKTFLKNYFLFSLNVNTAKPY